MSDKSIFGWIASTITLLYKLPQIYKIIKNKSSKDLSTRSLVLQSIGYIFYAIHGYVIEDSPILVMGGVALFENAVLTTLYFYFKSRTLEQSNESDN